MKKIIHISLQFFASFTDLLHKILPQRVVNTFFHYPVALLSVIFYRYPAKSLYVIGVTGTDGKTTAVYLIYEILKKAGKRVAMISTVEARIGEKRLSTGLHVTTPDPFELQRLLAFIAKKGFEYLVLETTSHGLDQHRLLGANFQIGVVTNVTWEHLDYHKTWQNYLKAKGKLFTNVEFSVLNIEDESYKYLKKMSRGRIITYGLKKGEINLKNFSFKTRLPGDYNKLNCLAAASVGRILKIKDSVIKETIADFKGVLGRMQTINMGQDFKVVVDFAHTPNGLKNALETLRKIPHRKLITVFGCAGLRDMTKRPMMGEIACQLADCVVLTAEDPRTEDVNKIIQQIVSGCKNKKKIFIEPDRQKAIELAVLKLAKKGDIVGIFGKGHERSMCFGKKEYPWSDQEAAKKTLGKRYK